MHDHERTRPARMAAHAWLAREVARLLRTSVGPDDDVRYQGRLVSVREWVPASLFADPDGASDDAIREAIDAAATRAAGAICARFA